VSATAKTTTGESPVDLWPSEFTEAPFEGDTCCCQKRERHVQKHRRILCKFLGVKINLLWVLFIDLTMIMKGFVFKNLFLIFSSALYAFNLLNAKLIVRL
jgi:hypothetical protein